MERELSVCRLEEMVLHHRIAAAMFVPFTVARLSGESELPEAILSVRLRGIGGTGEVERKLRLCWSPESVIRQPLGVQDNTVTEWAALGLACALLPHYAGVWIRLAATPGNSFDYWVTDGRWQYGLEVSGTMKGDVEARHREKLQQLRANRYGLDGYVAAANFAERTAIFSFNSFVEAPG